MAQIVILTISVNKQNRNNVLIIALVVLEVGLCNISFQQRHCDARWRNKHIAGHAMSSSGQCFLLVHIMSSWAEAVASSGHTLGWEEGRFVGLLGRQVKNIA